jgi:hypothetical protein
MSKVFVRGSWYTRGVNDDPLTVSQMYNMTRGLDPVEQKKIRQWLGIYENSAVPATSSIGPSHLSPEVFQLDFEDTHLRTLVIAILELSQYGMYSLPYPRLFQLIRRLHYELTTTTPDTEESIYAHCLTMCYFVLIVRIVQISSEHPIVRRLSLELRQFEPNNITDTLLVILARSPLRLQCPFLDFRFSLQDAYTPHNILNICKDFAGYFDTDVSGNFFTNSSIQAYLCYNEEVSGLSPENYWYGKVWMNPPYTAVNEMKEVKLLEWVKKALVLWDAESKQVEEIFMFMPNNSTTAWYNLLVQAKDAGKCMMYDVTKTQQSLQSRGDCRPSYQYANVFIHFTCNLEASKTYFSQAKYVVFKAHSKQTSKKRKRETKDVTPLFRPL